MASNYYSPLAGDAANTDVVIVDAATPAHAPPEVVNGLFGAKSPPRGRPSTFPPSLPSAPSAHRPQSAVRAVGGVSRYKNRPTGCTLSVAEFRALPEKEREFMVKEATADRQAKRRRDETVRSAGAPTAAQRNARAAPAGQRSVSVDVQVCAICRCTARRSATAACRSAAAACRSAAAACQCFTVGVRCVDAASLFW